MNGETRASVFISSSLGTCHGIIYAWIILSSFSVESLQLDFVFLIFFNNIENLIQLYDF